MSDNSVFANVSASLNGQATNNQVLADFSAVSDIDNIWLLPDGVSDLFSDEAQKQEWLRYQLTQVLVNRGYELICPPMIEFTESLLGNASEDLKRQTFKIIDQLSGRLMGVRADITPQISRIDAHLNKLHKADNVARYCYAGHVIRTLPNGLFGSRTPLQLGAEIFGCDSLKADIELIDVLYCLIEKLALNQDFHMDIGHIAIFARLKALASLSENQADALINLYANKALPELKKVCATLPMGEDFYQLAVQGHNVSALKRKLSDTAKNDAVILDAINDVEALVTYIKDNYQGNVSVDITELGYHYHTGIVFNGYFASESQAVVRGGRFNGSTAGGAGFTNGTDTDTRSATGFSLEVTRLQRRITLPKPKLIVVDYDDLQADVQASNNKSKGGINNDSINNDSINLEDTVTKLREAGERVIVPLNAADIPNGSTHKLVRQDNDWVIKAF